MKKIGSFLMILSLVIILFSFSRYELVKAQVSVYIRADGSIDPPSAPITTTDNVTYTLTGNMSIAQGINGIAVERDNIVLDGADYSIHGFSWGFYPSLGVLLQARYNVTIKNLGIRGFSRCIFMNGSSRIYLHGNTIALGDYGVYSLQSNGSTVTGNNITGYSAHQPGWYGIRLVSSSGNRISGNSLANCSYGVAVGSSPNNTIIENALTYCGIKVSSSDNCTIVGNNITHCYASPSINLRVSSKCNLSKNLMFDNRYSFEVAGPEPLHFMHFIDESNLVDGRPVYYLVNKTDLVLDPSTKPEVGYMALVNCHNMTVRNLTLSGNGEGVLFVNTNSSRIVANNITGNLYGVLLVFSSENMIGDNRIADTLFEGVDNYGGEAIRFDVSENNSVVRNNITHAISRGINCQHSNGNNVERNNVASVHTCILLSSCSNNSFSNNSLTPSPFGYAGFHLEGSTNNNIVGNNIEGPSPFGIRFSNFCEGNNVVGNNVTNCDVGISLERASFCNVSRNSVHGNTYNFDVFGTELRHFLHFIDESNLVDGKPVYYLVNRTDVILGPPNNPEAGYVALVNCRNVTVQNLTLENNGQGLLVVYSNSSRIVGNNITSNDVDGVYFRFSARSSIERNTLSANDIRLLDSSDNIISENRIVSGEIALGGSNNTVTGNDVTSGGGISASGTLHKIVGNSLTNCGIHLSTYSSMNLVSRNSIRKSAIGISLEQSSHNVVSGNRIDESYFDGLYARRSPFNSIVGNSITLSDSDGIRLYSSHNNTISGNNLTSNGIGLHIEDSSDVIIYHNNFINNSAFSEGYLGSPNPTNLWDDGYPSGGNYWSQYSGTDSNRDGLGDTPYSIDTKNRDNYPLMGMFHSYNASHIQQDLTTTLISNSSISDFTITFSTEHPENTSIKFNVTGETGFGFARICIPHVLMNETYLVSVDGTEPLFVNYTLADNGTHRWIYFTYTHSTREITIVPEYPSLMIVLQLVALVMLIAWRMKGHKKTHLGM